MNKAKVLEEHVTELKMIHEALAKNKYFGLTGDDAKQHLLLGMQIQMSKAWFFAEQKERNDGRLREAN